MSLTGKQTAFIHAYLGEARFNATRAAQLAGYRAKDHSLEAIGSENLTKPAIRAAIDEHFRMSRMSAEEVLIELTTLARGASRDKIKALALLSQHHSLLDGKWKGPNETPLEIQVRYVEPELRKREQEINDWTAGIEKDINELNAKGIAIYNEARAKFADSPDVQAFCELYEKMLGGKTSAPGEEVDDNIMLPTEKPLEVQIIPPQRRRLAPAPIERLMQDVVDLHPEPQPTLCRHGNPPKQCTVIDVGYDCPHWYRNKDSHSSLYA